MYLTNSYLRHTKSNVTVRGQWMGKYWTCYFEWW